MISVHSFAAFQRPAGSLIAAATTQGPGRTTWILISIVIEVILLSLLIGYLINRHIKRRRAGQDRNPLTPQERYQVAEVKRQGAMWSDVSISDLLDDSHDSAPTPPGTEAGQGEPEAVHRPSRDWDPAAIEALIPTGAKSVPLPLSAIVADASRPLEELTSVSASFDVDPMVRATNSADLREMVARLLVVSAHHSDSFAPLVLAASATRRDVELRISDLGAGMSEDDLLAAQQAVIGVEADAPSRFAPLLAVAPLAERLDATVRFEDRADLAGVDVLVHLPGHVFIRAIGDAASEPDATEHAPDVLPRVAALDGPTAPPDPQPASPFTATFSAAGSPLAIYPDRPIAARFSLGPDRSVPSDRPIMSGEPFSPGHPVAPGHPFASARPFVVDGPFVSGGPSSPERSATWLAAGQPAPAQPTELTETTAPTAPFGVPMTDHALDALTAIATGQQRRLTSSELDPACEAGPGPESPPYRAEHAAPAGEPTSNAAPAAKEQSISDDSGTPADDSDRPADAAMTEEAADATEATRDHGAAAAAEASTDQLEPQSQSSAPRPAAAIEADGSATAGRRRRSWFGRRRSQATARGSARAQELKQDGDKVSESADDLGAAVEERAAATPAVPNSEASRASESDGPTSDVSEGTAEQLAEPIAEADDKPTAEPIAEARSEPTVQSTSQPAADDDPDERTTDRAEPDEQTDGAEQTDQADRAGQADGAEQTDQAEPDEQTDGAERTDQNDQADDADQAEQTDQTELADRAEPEAAADPADREANSPPPKESSTSDLGQEETGAAPAAASAGGVSPRKPLPPVVVESGPPGPRSGGIAQLTTGLVVTGSSPARGAGMASKPTGLVQATPARSRPAPAVPTFSRDGFFDRPAHVAPAAAFDGPWFRSQETRRPATPNPTTSNPATPNPATSNPATPNPAATGPAVSVGAPTTSPLPRPVARPTSWPATPVTPMSPNQAFARGRARAATSTSAIGPVPAGPATAAIPLGAPARTARAGATLVTSRPVPPLLVHRRIAEAATQPLPRRPWPLG